MVREGSFRVDGRKAELILVLLPPSMRRPRQGRNGGFAIALSVKERLPSPNGQAGNLFIVLGLFIDLVTDGESDWCSRELWLTGKNVICPGRRVWFSALFVCSF